MIGTMMMTMMIPRGLSMRRRRLTTTMMMMMMMMARWYPNISKSRCHPPPSPW
jgi:hypothetical protein